MKNLYFLSLLFFGSVIVNGQNCLCIKVKDDISSDFERPVSIVLDNQKNYCWDKDIVLVKKNGMAEYFDPISGVGLGGKDFSWTAAIHLELLKDKIDINSKHNFVNNKNVIN